MTLPLCEHGYTRCAICAADDLSPSTGRKRKDRKRWCKGKVGREHNYVGQEKLYKSMGRSFPAVYLSQCSQCGKKKWEFIFYD